MKKYTKNRESQSRTVESNSNGFRQPPISEVLQAYRNGTLGRSPIQRESIEEDDDLIQTKTSGQPPVSAILQQYGEKRQKYASEEDEEIVQGKFDTAQRQEKSNNTGLPDNLKSGIENLSGYSMDDVKVHYNSDKPAQLNALAYTQGTNIHVAPGQEKHLPHEAWHVVQQKQGRVQPTMQIQGVNVNDNEGLENEANKYGKLTNSSEKNNVIQRQVCLLKDAFTDDFVENTSIDYSYKRAGGPIETFPTSDFSKMRDESKLYFVAHGAPGKAGNYTGEQIAARLTDTNVGLQKKISEIVFTSCNAGTNKSSTDDSVVDKVYKAVRSISPDITVKGATGVSIKSDATGDDFMVIDSLKEDTDHTLISKVQTTNLTTLGKYKQLMEIYFEGQKWDNLTENDQIAILYNLDIVNDWSTIFSAGDLQKSSYYLQKKDEKSFIDKIKTNPTLYTSKLPTTLPITSAPVLDIERVNAIISTTTATDVNSLVLNILSALPMELKTNPIFRSEFIARLTELFFTQYKKTLEDAGLLKTTADRMKIRKK